MNQGGADVSVRVRGMVLTTDPLYATDLNACGFRNLSTHSQRYGLQ
jgi:hypothetical protein